MKHQQIEDISNLYKSIYEEKEENLNENPLLDRARSTVVDAGGRIGGRVGKSKGPLGEFFGSRKGEKTAGTAFDQATSGNVGGAVKTVRDALRETKDSFDIVKGHLIDEGYANTEEAALAIMANMSEEWKQSILEADQPVGKAKLNPDGSGTQKTTGGNTIHYDRHVDYRSKEAGKKGTRTSVPFSGTAGCPPSGCAF